LAAWSGSKLGRSEIKKELAKKTIRQSIIDVLLPELDDTQSFAVYDANSLETLAKKKTSPVKVILVFSSLSK
jgi:hypothetical protein